MRETMRAMGIAQDWSMHEDGIHARTMNEHTPAYNAEEMNGGRLTPV